MVETMMMNSGFFPETFSEERFCCLQKALGRSQEQ
jgi:hypothetical protein